MLFHEFYMEQQFMLSVDGFYSVNKSSKFGRSRFQRTFPEIVLAKSSGAKDFGTFAILSN